MKANPLCLLLNKRHFLSLTQDRFILIQTLIFTCVLQGCW